MNVIDDIYPSRVENQPKIIGRQDPVVYGQEKQKGPLTPVELNHYQKNGFLFVEKLFSEEEILFFLEELKQLKNTPNPENDPKYIVEPNSGNIRSIFQVHDNSLVFKRVSKDARIVDIIEQILDSQLYIHQSRINLKPGFEGKEFYWHSDFETWHIEDGMPRMRAVSCSIALTDNYSFNGPLMVIPGSHEYYISCVGETPEDHYRQSLKKQEYGVPSHENLEWLVRKNGIQMPVGSAGSALFFDCNIMHGSNGNITPYPRTNLFFVYNSIKNKVGEPFANIKPRPEFIASRDSMLPIQATEQVYV